MVALFSAGAIAIAIVAVASLTRLLKITWYNFTRLVRAQPNVAASPKKRR
jgi:hypothetical protein